MAEPEQKIQGSPAYEIYIMRHGLAVRRGIPGFEDSKRPLTPQGRAKMERVAKGLKRLEPKLDWVVTSPLLRAAETAQIVADILGAKIPFDVCNELRPGAAMEKLLAFLAAQPDRRRILLVGHEPDLSALTARLIGAHDDANFSFKKGGCCLISFDGAPLKSHGQLIWWLTPRVFRAIT